MKHHVRRRVPRPAATRAPALRGATVSGAVAAALVIGPMSGVPHIWNPSGGPGYPPAPAPAATQAASFRQIILPDLAVIAPKGLSGTALARLAHSTGVRKVLAVDGASVTVHGRRVNVIGVNPQQFRSWTPLATASDQGLWSALSGGGGFVASPAVARRLRLRRGHIYHLDGAASLALPYVGTAALGVAGIDVIVSNRDSARLGLIHNVAALVSAPALRMPALRREVRSIVGHGATLVSLRQQQLGPAQPVTSPRPTTYLQLFRRSAAHYCPGLSWTVLAAIGQIESGDGANNGPSRAGALGPMQFLPSTWQAWGITAFGQPGPPDIMDPYDAVPAAARYLCAAGGGTPAGLPRAIYAYNHATWYVNEVLALARQYSQTYG